MINNNTRRSFLSIGYYLVILKMLLLSPVFSACSSISSGPVNNSTYSNNSTVYQPSMTAKEKTMTFLNSFNNPGSIDFSIVDDLHFVQHDLTIKDGKQAYINSILEKTKNGFQLEIARAIQDKDHVFIQSKQTSTNEINFVYDVFRFSKGFIVEHWINVEKSNPVNPSGRSQIDGPTEISDLDRTEVNKTLVKDYLTTIVIEKRLNDVPQFLDGNKYIQHNSNVPDGLDSILDLLERFEREGISVGFSKIHKVIGEGNFVLAISEGYYEKDPIAYFDLLRVENGKIAEHWDVIQAIPPEKQQNNTNGKF